MHNWGDDRFDWYALDGALNIISKKLRFWRVPVRQVKEKFGTARVYCSLGFTCLHDITHPGHAYYRFPKWIVALDIDVLSKIITFLLGDLSLIIHRIVYRHAYKCAVKKYPHIYQEIVCCADYTELLIGLEKFAKV